MRNFKLAVASLLVLVASMLPADMAKPSEIGISVAAAQKPLTTLPEASYDKFQAIDPVVTSAMAYVFSHESSNNPRSINSIGACGLGQSLPCSKMASVCPNWRNDAACQINWFTQYANNRYGGWENAKWAWDHQLDSTGNHWW